jgi:hypothetical protein
MCLIMELSCVRKLRGCFRLALQYQVLSYCCSITCKYVVLKSHSSLLPQGYNE